MTKDDLIQLLKYTLKFNYNIKNITFSLDENYNNSSCPNTLKMSINSVIAMSKSCKKYNDDVFTKIINKYHRKINNYLTTMMFCDKCNNLHSKSLTNLTKNNTMSYLTYVLKRTRMERIESTYV